MSNTYLPPFNKSIYHKDFLGNLYFGTMEGLYIFNPESETFFRYAHTTHPVSQLSHNSILNMFIDDHDGLWLGTRAGGVGYTNLNTSGFVKYEFSIFNSEYYLNNNNVYTFQLIKVNQEKYCSEGLRDLILSDQKISNQTPIFPM